MPVDLTRKKNNYVDRLSNRVGNLLEAMDNLAALRREWDELGFVDGGSAAIADADIAGQFPHLSAANVAAVMTTIDNFATLRAAGNGTNLSKLRP